MRLAESPLVKEKFAGEHSGYFALKVLKKSEILRLKQLDHVKAERDLLLHKINHPFIVNVYHTYKDDRNLFMIMEYVPGGEVLAKCRADVSTLNNDLTKCAARR